MKSSQGYLLDTNVVLHATRQQSHVWIAATAHTAGLKLLTTDGSAFLPLRGSEWLHVEVLDPKTGIIVP